MNVRELTKQELTEYEHFIDDLRADVLKMHRCATEPDQVEKFHSYYLSLCDDLITVLMLYLDEPITDEQANALSEFLTEVESSEGEEHGTH